MGIVIFLICLYLSCRYYKEASFIMEKLFDNEDNRKKTDSVGASEGIRRKQGRSLRQGERRNLRGTDQRLRA